LQLLHHNHKFFNFYFANWNKVQKQITKT
jgi:hypothetical protein